MALLKEASEMFDETGCVPGIYGEQVPAETIVPDVKEYISETIDDPETMYDPEIWDTPGFALVLSWLAQKWKSLPLKICQSSARACTHKSTTLIDVRLAPTSGAKADIS
jgi:hypothetical protein